MKTFSLWLAAWLIGSLRLVAQVTVDIALDQDQYLASETLQAAVRITNRSGQTLVFGEEPDWLTISAETRNGGVVSKVGEIPVVGRFELGSSKVATKRLDLAPYFDLTKPGRYSITATVKIKGWDKQFSSKPKSFDIIQGARLWEQEFGLPLSPGAANQSPEVRKYILQQANYLERLRLYVRLTDVSEQRVFKVLAVGHMVSFSQLEKQIDKLSNLHILYQSGARSYSYTVFSPEGEVLRRQTYNITNTRPRLQSGPDGKIVVAGGLAHPTANDVTRPESSTAPDDAKTPP